MRIATRAALEFNSIFDLILESIHIRESSGWGLVGITMCLGDLQSKAAFSFITLWSVVERNVKMDEISSCSTHLRVALQLATV